MTQENKEFFLIIKNSRRIYMEKDLKELLLKDLCARLPYGVKCCVYDRIGTLCEYSNYGVGVDYEDGEDTTCRIEYCKPYLFPLSSMTSEQKKEYAKLLAYSSNVNIIQITGESTYDWLNRNMFDWRGLIPRGLALDATRLNIY